MKTITIKIKELPEGKFLCTSPDIKGLVVQGNDIAQVMKTGGKVIKQIFRYC